MFLYVFGMCFTWPALEALVSEGETSATLPRHIGIYNLMWAGTGALSYFIGGALLDRLGNNSIFYVPAALHLLELALAFAIPALNTATVSPAAHGAQATAHAATVKTKSFLRMAWLANPFAYIAVNTLVAVVPGLALKFNLNSSQAGFVCSVWCFARFGAFAFLWWWTGWHYRFRWLLTGYLALTISFVSMLAAPNLPVLVVMQLMFGCALGLIYYSSLFYSMDRTENHGEHGGIHEAAIGLGNFVGPAVGSASLYLGSGNSAGAVGGLLVLGLGGLFLLYHRGRYSGD
jgi:MFS family permease